MWPFKKKHRITPDYIYKLKKNQVFVFGSNLAGKHDGGAAKQALQWGAVYGNPVGIQGKTYAIPTLGRYARILSLEMISVYVDEFIRYTRLHLNKKFYVTEIGCGIAGYTPEEIAPLFREVENQKNVWLPERFVKVLAKHNRTET